MQHEESGQDQEESEIIEGGNGASMKDNAAEEYQKPQSFCDEVVVVHTTERETLPLGQVSGLPAAAAECDSVHMSESDKVCNFVLYTKKQLIFNVVYVGLLSTSCLSWTFYGCECGSIGIIG